MKPVKMIDVNVTEPPENKLLLIMCPDNEYHIGMLHDVLESSEIYFLAWVGDDEEKCELILVEIKSWRELEVK